ncbi:YopX family protein [Helcococcus kunzii]|uniref:YopX family protein n=1 Tax=Helcococcus kunzii TaxID=40091 RepID=UPI00389F3844
MIPKFRAWHKSTELMDEVIIIDFYNEKIGILYADPVIQGESVKIYSFDEVVLMQSTGLKDKNGEEIFEGDILKGDDGEFFYNSVVFDKEKAIFMRSDSIELWENVEELEVIGNIYENPELLEG